MNTQNTGKPHRIELLRGITRIDSLVENGVVRKDTDRNYYVEIQTMKQLFELYDEIHKNAGVLLKGLILDKNEKTGNYRLFIYDDWIE